MLLATYGEDEVDLDSALLELLAEGDWGPARDHFARGLSALEEGFTPLAGDLKRAEERFRRQRNLLSGDDLRRWLTSRDLGIGDLRAYLRVELAAGERPGLPPPPADLAEACRRGLLLDGSASKAARRVVMGAAAADILGSAAPQRPDEDWRELATRAADDPALPVGDREGQVLGAKARRVLQLRAALGALGADLADGEVDDVLAEKALEWTELQYAELSLATPQAAREAIMCLSQDGLGLAEVAALAGTVVNRHACLAGEVSAPLSPHLLSGQPGQPLGPVRDGERWSVVVLDQRRAPSADDDGARGKAREVALSRKLERRLAGRARWHAAAI